MTTQNTKRQVYRELEQISEHAKQSFLQQFIAYLQQITREIIRRLTASEPIVKQVRDKKGRICWHVYDPASERRAYLASEQDVLVWLEERFGNEQPGGNWSANLSRSQQLR
jgi:hypothetical protein